MLFLGGLLAAEFSRRNTQSRRPPARFLEIVRVAGWRHMADVKATFNTADFDSEDQVYIFDIGGNRYRLLARIDFEAQILRIIAVMTHEQYNRR